MKTSNIIDVIQNGDEHCLLNSNNLTSKGENQDVSPSLIIFYLSEFLEVFKCLVMEHSQGSNMYYFQDTLSYQQSKKAYRFTTNDLLQNNFEKEAPVLIKLQDDMDEVQLNLKNDEPEKQGFDSSKLTETGEAVTPATQTLENQPGPSSVIIESQEVPNPGF